MTLMDEMTKQLADTVQASRRAEATCVPDTVAEPDIPPMAEEDRRALVISALESAAVRLRDAELAKVAAVREYQRALDAFNRFVAPGADAT